MSKADELKSKNENLFERNTILLNENERLKKENAELECKLEETEKDLADYQFNYPSIKELSKENAELKRHLEKDCCTCWKADNQLGEKNKQLAQAREILQEYVRINLMPPIERNFDDEIKLFKQAEQFLEKVK